MRSMLTVLLVDDDKDDCFLFGEAIDELNIDVDVGVDVDLSMISDSSELIQSLKNGTVDLPDALFLDLNMPKKNGLECLTEIKSHPKLQHLVVIIFSTSYDPGIASQLYETGATFYICKPSDFSSLKKLISEVLTRIKGAPLAQIPQKDFFLTLSK